ncbi:synaptotagmin-like protein 2 isoform X11 [Silurus asotus]|uniref:Synaptotagmin-like protein 2 isoform X11 n=1 Tax=Silurus asotus TaxID=30991 RepID=A0AAD5B5U5_SILAS|nr:synaptotagmin-like protein 2 isoform X11 [Silurus asotus]
MIDLSYLTEEEQEMILSVLKRDAELKHAEEQRIKKLQKTERDKCKLKYLTGEWFYETKSNRHRDKTHACDIIKASMSRRKPVTIMELTQIWPGKSNFLKIASKDIFIPPELSGLIGEASSVGHDDRQNPFNSRPIGAESPVKTDGHLRTGAGIQQTPTISYQAPEDQPLSSLPKACQAPQIPAEAYHEDLAVPRSSHVSEHSDPFEEEGKVNQLSTEGQFHTLTEEDESSIYKVLGCVGMMSRHNGKGNGGPGVQEEQNREGPEAHGSPDTENISHIPGEIKANLSPKDKIPGLYLRNDQRVETSEYVQGNDEVNDVFQPDDKQDSVILESSAQHSASGMNILTDELEANLRHSVIERSKNIADDDVQQQESLCQESQNRLAGLMSFWESENKGPKVLSFKKSVINEKVSEQKISKEKPSKYTDVCASYKGFSDSHNGARYDDNISVIPFLVNDISLSEKMASFDPDQNPQEHELERESTFKSKNSPTKQMEDIPLSRLKESPLLSVRSVSTEQDTPSDLKAYWEKENSIFNIISSSPDCENHSQQGVNQPNSTGPNHLEPGIRNISPVFQDHGDQLTGDTVKTLQQTRIPSPRNMPKVLFRIEESRKSVALPLDLSKIEKKRLECTFKGQTRKPHGLSGEESEEDEMLDEMQEKHLLSFSGNTPERNIHCQLTSPQSQAPRTMCIDKTNIKQSSQVHSLSEQHRKTTTEISGESIEDQTPVVLTEQMQLDDLENKPSLTRPSIHLKCQDSPSFTENTNMSGVSDQTDEQEGAGVHVCESSEHMSPSGQDGNEDLNLVRTAQNQASVRPLSISKSLEDLATLPSTPDSLSIAVLDPEKSKRLSVSVPAFMHEQVSGSVTNIYGTDFGHVDIKGSIQFAINYVNKLGELHIFIVQCRDLAVAEPKRNRSDPYVKCYLLPDKAKLGKRKTSVKKKTLNPTYNEILRYKTPLESLKFHTLNISVWHHDTFGRNSFLGEANVDLSDGDNNTNMMDFPLKGRTQTPSSPKHISHNMEMCGDIRISLRFLLQTQSNKMTQTGEIQIWVKECTNLPFKRRTVDPFVKCSIFPDNPQKKRQKTQVVKRTANPVFNHIMVYEGLKPEDLHDTCVELTVWDHDRLSNHFLGGTRLSLGTGKSHGTEVKWMDSNSVESELWRRTIESNNQWVEDTVPLRMFVMARQ